MNNTPKTLSDLQAAITQSHTRLSNRLQQVAQYLVDHPNKIAFGTVAVISKDAGVHPSTLVRFANAFGYGGFSEMQRLFQQKLLNETTSYTERIRIAREELGEGGKEGKEGEAGKEAKEGGETPFNLLTQFSAANADALDQLKNNIAPADMEQAVDILASAAAIHIIGVRRSYVVASYLSYALSHIEQRAFLVDGVGGTYREQAGSIASGDALIAVSFHPYAQETQDVVMAASEKGIPLIVITDTQLSPLAAVASVCFTIKEAQVHSFRSLTSSLCLAQSLSIGLAYRMDKQKALTVERTLDSVMSQVIVINTAGS